MITPLAAAKAYASAQKGVASVGAGGDMPEMLSLSGPAPGAQGGFGDILKSAMTDAMAALLYHTPFPKMAQKAHTRLVDHERRRRGGPGADVEHSFAALVEPSLGAARRVGNTYTASLYLCLAWLLEHDTVVICAGGGGIPTTYEADRKLVGVEGVIDKDHASGLLARDVGADLFVMATDARAAFVGFGTAEQQRVVVAHPDALLETHRNEFAAGSMLPKVIAACDFARLTGKPAVIGALADIEALVSGSAGTRITTEIDGVEIAPSPPQEG